MRSGRIVQVGEPTELYFRPADAFAAEFFGEVNRIPARVTDNMVSSPFGRLPAGGIAEGYGANAVIMCAPS